MKIPTIAALFLSLFTTAFVFAQDAIPRDGIFTPGTSLTMTSINTTPVCWINATNEFNVYIPGEAPLLLTIQNEKNPNLGKLPDFKSTFVTDYSFVLTANDDRRYYFAVDSYEEKQVFQIVKGMGSEFVKTDYGYGYAKHTVADVSLEKLKAAKSVYDVLEE